MKNRLWLSCKEVRTGAISAVSSGLKHDGELGNNLEQGNDLTFFSSLVKSKSDSEQRVLYHN
jgi:hypothetical protein